MKTAIGYIRVSTDHQAKEGVSLESQKTKIEGWAAYQGYDLLKIEQDAGISGSSMKDREGLARALDEVEKFGGTLVVYSLSRMARSTIDALNILDRITKAGGELVSLTENIDTSSAAGRMFVRMIAVFAEFERETMLERCEAARDLLRSQNKPLNGAPPYGYKIIDGTLVEDPVHMHVVNTIMSFRNDMKWSYGDITARLNNTGIPAPRGGKWSKATVRLVYNYHTHRKEEE